MQMPADATGAIVTLNQDGDSKHFWNAQDPESVGQAQGVFSSYVEKGFRAFLMNESGEQGEVMDAFDPAAGSILFVPPLAGG